MKDLTAISVGDRAHCGALVDFQDLLQSIRTHHFLPTSKDLKDLRHDTATNMSLSSVR